MRGHLCALFQPETFPPYLDVSALHRLRVVLRKLSSRVAPCMPGHQFEAVFDHGHHAETSRSTLIIFQVSTVFLIHWITVRPAIEARSKELTAASCPRRSPAIRVLSEIDAEGLASARDSR